MKLPSILLILLSLAGVAQAEFRKWTNRDQKVAELELLSVSDVSGEKVGLFRMRNLTRVSLPASSLIEDDAKILNAWKPVPKAGAAKPSVFDAQLDGNLLVLDGESLKPLERLEKPTKYYLFYYTASWCGPCQRFTPSLVEFYSKKKSNEFEVVLISSDRDEKAMEGYAVSKKMPWPHLKLPKIPAFRQEFQHPGGGIPNLVLCDLQGKIIKGSYDGGQYIGPHPVMAHLETLLKD